METDLKACRLCTELTESLHSARQPDPPALLLGLTEAGKRNRAHQRQEKIEKFELLLSKHQRTMHAAPVAEPEPVEVQS